MDQSDEYVPEEHSVGSNDEPSDLENQNPREVREQIRNETDTVEDVENNNKEKKKCLCKGRCIILQNKKNREFGRAYQSKKKEEARSEKGGDKLFENDVVLTVDLQSVLLAPKAKVTLVYYKTKLAVHNYTLYDIKSNDGY
ncbi:unnamed protein product [Psylliodes chrysocephalus]|uniref:Uncharacterized protein n=1 Tax=Psylliodes chrysocephalus TaxID=3402493 RepID=A0A9P0CS89_9CUCU|nr:unnamed protein product [Psylliodes chrysocephala]